MHVCVGAHARRCESSRAEKTLLRQCPDGEQTSVSSERNVHKKTLAKTATEASTVHTSPYHEAASRRAGQELTSGPRFPFT